MVQDYPDDNGISSTPADMDANPPASSTGTDDVAPSSSAVSPEAAPSPDKKEDLLSVVMDAVKPKEATTDTETTASEQPASGEQGVPEKQADPAEVPAEELAKYTPKARQRIEELAKQNRTHRQQLDAYKPIVESHQQLVSYMQANDLQQEHLGTLLEFGAALRKGNLQAAKEMMAPYWDLINEGLGDKLPADVQRKVDEGVLEEASARELTRLRHERERLQATTQRMAQTNQQELVVRHQAEIGRGVDAWEHEIRQRDPDYARKADAVNRFAKAIVAERGTPSSVDQARQWAAEAYEEVNKTFAQLRPAPKPTRTGPTGGVHSATPVSAEPSSLMEAALLGLNRSRAGL